MVILDNGHGGVIGGVYQTKGKRSPQWSKGILYEGAFNRWIVNGIIKELDILNIPYFNLAPEYIDVPLNERLFRATEYAKANDNIFLLSIHANAAGGTGWECFIHNDRENISSNFAKDFIRYMKSQITDLPLREGENTTYKKAEFYILNSNIPSLLLECGFMDNINDYNLLWDIDFQNTIIKGITSFIKNKYNNKPIPTNKNTNKNKVIVYFTDNTQQVFFIDKDINIHLYITNILTEERKNKIDNYLLL